MQSGAKAWLLSSLCPTVPLALLLAEATRADPGPSRFHLDGLLVLLLKSKGDTLFCFQAESPGWSGLQFLKVKVKVNHLHVPGNMKMLNYSRGCLTLVLKKDTFQEAVIDETWGPA